MLSVSQGHPGFHVGAQDPKLVILLVWQAHYPFCHLPALPSLVLTQVVRSICLPQTTKWAGLLGFIFLLIYPTILILYIFRIFLYLPDKNALSYIQNSSFKWSEHWLPYPAMFPSPNSGSLFLTKRVDKISLNVPHVPLPVPCSVAPR